MTHGRQPASHTKVIFFPRDVRFACRVILSSPRQRYGGLELQGNGPPAYFQKMRAYMNGLLACMLALCLVTSYAAGFTAPPDLLPVQPPDSGERVVPIAELLDLPDSVLFGNVGVGYCKDTIFILKASQAIRTPIGFYISGDTTKAFSVIADSIKQGSDSVRFTVRFCPSMNTYYTGHLVVAGDEDSVDIPLAGIAIRTALPFDGSVSIDLGTITPGSSRYDTTWIGLGDMDFIQILDISFRNQPQPPIFEVLEPQRELVLFKQGGDSARIVAGAYGTERGIYTHKMTISTTMGWRDIEFRVVVDTTASYPRVEVLPPELNFGGVPVGGCIERTVTIRNLGDVPVLPEYLPVTSGRGFTLIRSGTAGRLLSKGDTASVTFRFCPDSALPYSAAGSVQLVFNGTDSAFTIPLSGYGFNGYWENIPLLVDFGAVQIDSCRDTTLVFPNILAVAVFRAWFEMTGNSNTGFTAFSPASGVIESGDSLRIHMRFCPSGVGDAVDFFLMDSPQSQRLLSIPVTGRGVIGILDFPGSVEFGEVPVGECDDQQVVITNNGEGLAWLDWFADQVGPPFRLLNKPRSPHVLRPNESVTVSIEFCPDDVRSFDATWNGTAPMGTQLQILLSGEGTVQEGRDISLGTSTANVGEPVRLVLRAGVAFKAAEGILFDSALIVFNYRSIVLQRVIGMAVPGAGGEMAWEHVRDNIFRIRRVRGTMPIDGNDLFAVEFIGLSTGQPQNTVRIEGIWFSRNIDPRITANGQVDLIGCDIGRTGTFTKRVAIRAIQSDPLSSAIDIAYNAPEGSMPMLGLVNLEGRRIFTRELPRGTGEEQSLHMLLEGVPAGLYLLELRVEDDLTTARIMVRE